MDIDAHYYAVLAFCRGCGFSKESAQTIAYASQFVDDAKINHITIQGDPNSIEHDVIDGKSCFFNMATCHNYFRIKTFNYCAMTGNTVAFHFAPGNKGKNFFRKLRCMEESPIIVEILNKALDQNDLVKLGMVLHAYADTFSHQGFSGLLSKVNDIARLKRISRLPRDWLDKIKSVGRFFLRDKFDRLLDSAAPCYGHAQALTYPDLPYLIWSYHYDYCDQFSAKYKSSNAICNEVRFKRAFGKIKGHLQTYLNNHPEYRDAQVNFQNFDLLYNALILEKAGRKRRENWRNVIREQGLLGENDPWITYDEDRWLKEAFEDFEEKRYHQRKVEGAVLRENFKDCRWYQFYKAVKWYKKEFFKLCSDRGLEIPR